MSGLGKGRKPGKLNLVGGLLVDGEEVGGGGLDECGITGAYPSESTFWTQADHISAAKNLISFTLSLIDTLAPSQQNSFYGSV